MTMTRTLILLAAAGATLAACGIRGDLERPDPLFGTPEGLPEASLSNRTVDDGLEALDEDDPDAPREDGLSTPPDAEDELLGGPGGAL